MLSIRGWIHFIIYFPCIYFFASKELSVRANEVPFLDVENDSEAFFLKVLGRTFQEP